VGLSVSARRILKPDEVQILLTLSTSTDSNWEVIVASPDEQLFSLIKDIFVDDPLVKVASVQNGCDFLVTCAREIPDLVIIDEALPDIPFGEIVRCIKRNTFLKNIKVFCNLNTIAPSEIDFSGADDFISPDNYEKIYISRKVNSLLYRSTTHRDMRTKPQRERRWPRINLNINVRIEVFDTFGPVRYDHGEAQLENISRDGAYITKIQLNKGRIPEGTFCIRLRANKPPLKDWQADAVVIRVENRTAGLNFQNISKEDKKKVMEMYD